MYSTNRTEWKEIRKTFFLTITYSDTAVRGKIRLIRSRDINWLNYIMNFFTTGRSRKISQPFYNKKFFSPFSFQLFFTLPYITYFTLLHHIACLYHHQQHRIASYYTAAIPRLREAPLLFLPCIVYFLPFVCWGVRDRRLLQLFTTIRIGIGIESLVSCKCVSPWCVLMGKWYSLVHVRSFVFHLQANWLRWYLWRHTKRTHYVFLEWTEQNGTERTFDID